MVSILPGNEYYPFWGVSSFINADEPEDRVAGRLGATLPGDLLLIRTPGPAYEIGRKITRNLYDHVAVVLEGGRTLNIVNPKTVILPVQYFARPGRRPLVLRPAWRSEKQWNRFVSAMAENSGGRYDLRKTVIGVVTTVLYGWLGIALRMRKPEPGSSSWICTEAILTKLVECMPEFAAVGRLDLDYNIIGFATTNDFLRICIELPELLRVVA